MLNSTWPTQDHFIKKRWNVMSFFIDKATFLLHSIQYIVWERNIESLKNNLWLLSAGHLAGWAAAPRGTLSLAAAVFAVAAAAVALAGHQPEHQAGQLRLRVILFSHLTCWLRAAWQKHPIKEEKREIHKKKIMCRPINNCKQYCGAGAALFGWSRKKEVAPAPAPAQALSYGDI